MLSERDRRARRACFAFLAIGLPLAIASGSLPELAALRLRFVLVAAGIVAIGVGLRLNQPKLRRPWLLLVAGLSSSLTGDAIVLSVSSGDTVTANVPADAWLTSLAGLLILAAMFDATRTVRGSDHGGTLDAIVLALAGGTAVWHLGVVAAAVPGWAGGGTEIAGALQVFFLVAVFGLLVRTARVLPSGTRSVMVLLATGLLAALAAFLLGAFREASGDAGSHYAGARAAFGAAANLLAGAAALHPTMRMLTERRVPAVDRLSVVRLAALGIALMVPPALFVVAEFRDTPTSPVTLVAAWAVLVPAVLARIRLLGAARDAAWSRAVSTEQRLASLVANTGDALLVVHRGSGPASWKIVYASPAARRQLGIDPEVLLGRDVASLVIDDDLPVLAELLNSDQPRPRSVDVRVVEYAEDPRWIEVVVDGLPQEDTVEGLVLTIRDVTDRKRAAIQWEHAAISDPLTGLLNRRGVEARLDSAFEQALADDALLGIAVADLDGFKAINDAHGHVVGDEVLRQVASRLTAAVRADDAVGRIGGDEFIVVTTGVDSREAIDRVVRRIPDAVRRPIYVDRLELGVDISLGVALADVENDSAGQLIRRADAALYQAKAGGKGRIVWAEDVIAVSSHD